MSNTPLTFGDGSGWKKTTPQNHYSIKLSSKKKKKSHALVIKNKWHLWIKNIYIFIDVRQQKFYFAHSSYKNWPKVFSGHFNSEEPNRCGSDQHCKTYQHEHSSKYKVTFPEKSLMEWAESLRWSYKGQCICWEFRRPLLRWIKQARWDCRSLQRQWPPHSFPNLQKWRVHRSPTIK